MPAFDTLHTGDELPAREHLATNVSLFLYNAAVWNAHRIHYDERYTTEVERHPGVVIDGPLQGDWLTQVVLDWLGEDGQMLEFEYSNRRAAYLGQTLIAGGSIAAIDDARGEVALDLHVKDEQGQIITPGRAVVALRRD
jgi:hydroxyacyl-ACP dehydratase HTD2-like protein with hotdog domain